MEMCIRDRNKKAYNSFIIYLIKEGKKTENKDKKNITRKKIINYVLNLSLIHISICLTTMLLVIISTVGNGMSRLQKSQAAGSYGSNYGLFVAADASQLKEVYAFLFFL